MTRAKKRKKKKVVLSVHGKMAEALLPPAPINGLQYTRRYFESFRSKLFNACRNGRHRHCPVTSDQKDTHLYCKCPCHVPGLTRHRRRLMLEVMKKELAKEERKKSGVPRDRVVTHAVGTRGKQKTFVYVKPLEKIPAGIMAIVHNAIAALKKGSVAEITAQAIANGLRDVTGQDPTSQTSIMLHRMLKAGVVEITNE